MREDAFYCLLVYGLLERVSCRPPEPFGRGLEAEGEQSCLGELQQDLIIPGSCRLCLHSRHSNAEPFPGTGTSAGPNIPLPKASHRLQHVPM